MLDGVLLDNYATDLSSWKLSNDGRYATKSAYKRSHLLSNVYLGLEAMGATKVQIFLLVNSPKPGRNGG
jgi:hypothetical protein